MASAMTVANAQDGWYGRADLGYTFEGTLDHDGEPLVPYSIAGTSDADSGVYGAQVGLGYGFDNGFRLESTLGYRFGALEESRETTGFGLPVPPAPNVAYQAGGGAESTSTT